MMDKKKTEKKVEKSHVSDSEKMKNKHEESKETVSNGLPEDVDFKKFLGCGG